MPFPKTVHEVAAVEKSRISIFRRQNRDISALRFDTAFKFNAATSGFTNEIPLFQRQENKFITTRKTRRISSLLFIDENVSRKCTNAIRANTLLFVLRVCFVKDCSERFYLSLNHLSLVFMTHFNDAEIHVI